MTTSIDVEHFRTQLLVLEQTMADRAERAMHAGRNEFIDIAHDTADASSANEVAAEKFTEAEMTTETLTLIREALVRINDGTYGKCLVDGGPIEAKRLEAVPWAQHCLKHADLSVPRLRAHRTTL